MTAVLASLKSSRESSGSPSSCMLFSFCWFMGIGFLLPRHFFWSGMFIVSPDGVKCGGEMPVWPNVSYANISILSRLPVLHALPSHKNMPWTWCTKLSSLLQHVRQVFAVARGCYSLLQRTEQRVQ